MQWKHPFTSSKEGQCCFICRESDGLLILLDGKGIAFIGYLQEIHPINGEDNVDVLRQLWRVIKTKPLRKVKKREGVLFYQDNAPAYF